MGCIREDFVLIQNVLFRFVLLMLYRVVYNLDYHHGHFSLYVKRKIIVNLVFHGTSEHTLAAVDDRIIFHLKEDKVKI